MSKKLFVGNLPFEVNDADLGAVLGVAGTVVSAKVVINKKTGRSKGYGFVEMETEEMAKEAVAKFEGATLNERAITVQIAADKPEGKSAAGDSTPDSTGDSTGGNGMPHGIEATATHDPTAGTEDAPAEGSREIGDATQGVATSSTESTGTESTGTESTGTESKIDAGGDTART